MKRIYKIIIWIAGVIIGVPLLSLIGIYTYSAVTNHVDLNPTAYHWEMGMSKKDIETAALDLLSKMTVEEKVDQLAGNKDNMWRIFSIAAINKKMGHPYSGRNKRLDIPPLSFSDGPRGIVSAKGTSFPVAMARGASWDVELEKQVADVMGKEARAAGVNYYAGVCINVLRHPSWGRAQETFGEDPWLLGEMGLALANGVQDHNVMACIKHFAANSIENNRTYVNINVDERTLHEVYFPHFKKIADNGVASIMSAYNKVNGRYCGHDPYLLTTILRDEWGWEGFISSDWVQGIRDAEQAANAGMDVEMPTPQDYGDKLLKVIEEGKVSMEQIDKMVLRVLKTKLKFITREDPMEYSKELIAAEDHVKLARKVSEESMVLLKNDRDFLPLKKSSVKKLAIIGKLIDEEVTGDDGSSRVNSKNIVTPLAGIENYLGEDVEVSHCEGEDLEEAKKLAREADVVILVAGYEPSDEGEYINAGKKEPRTLEEEMEFRANLKWYQYVVGGDRLDLRLKERDLILIDELSLLNPNTVVSIIAGSAVIIEEWKDKVPAVLMSWYSGMEGGNALARILFGDVNPSGKLPFTVARDEQDYPPFDAFGEEVDYGYYHGYSLFDKQGIEPAFPFGFGMSYTEYSYDGLKVITPELSPEGTLQISVEVSNTGPMAGKEIVQLYIGFENSEIDRPLKLLRGFKKIDLAPGETRTVTMQVPVKELAYYNARTASWETEEMTYQVYVGPSSAQADLIPGEFQVK